MSLKIYNGYLLSGMNLDEACKLLCDFRETANAAATEHLTLTGANLLRGFPQGAENETQEARAQRVRDFMLEQIIKLESSPYRLPLVDTRAEVSLIPSPRGCLVILYTDCHPIIMAWNALEAVQEYAVWDNTDPPENLSTQAWQERLDTWEAAMEPHNWVPARAGVTVAVTDLPLYTPLPSAEAIIARAAQNETEEMKENAE